MSCRPLDVESFRNRARLPKGITRRKRAGYDESKKVSRTLLITNDPHLRCFHQLNRPALAFLVSQHAGEDPVAVTVLLEVFLLDPLPALFPVSSPAPAPHHLEDPMIHIRKGALARRITVIHGPALDLLVQTLDHCSCRQAARVVDWPPVCSRGFRPHRESSHPNY